MLSICYFAEFPMEQLVATTACAEVARARAISRLFYQRRHLWTLWLLHKQDTASHASKNSHRMPLAISAQLNTRAFHKSILAYTCSCKRSCVPLSGQHISVNL